MSYRQQTSSGTHAHVKSSLSPDTVPVPGGITGHQRNRSCGAVAGCAPARKLKAIAPSLSLLIPLSSAARLADAWHSSSVWGLYLQLSALQPHQHTATVIWAHKTLITRLTFIVASTMLVSLMNVHPLKKIFCILPSMDVNHYFMLW